MWITAMLASLNSIVREVAVTHKVSRQIYRAIITTMAIGFGGYQANIIQFGLDQLQDASTTGITAFISWFTWSYFSSSAIMNLLHMTVCMTKEYHILGLTMTCTCDIALCYFSS